MVHQLIFYYNVIIINMNMNNNYFDVKKCYGQDRSDSSGSYDPGTYMYYIYVIYLCHCVYGLMWLCQYYCIEGMWETF